MADGTVAVRQATTPDRLIDNDVLQNSNGDTVYRQKVLAPVTDGKLDAINDLLSGEVDAGNSSTTLLGASGVFTGTGVEVTTYAAIYVSVITDADSATDGLSVQFSHNGTDWEENNGYTVTANQLKILTPNPSVKFFRIVYTNGVQAQTTFALQTILKRTPTVSNSFKLTDVLSTDTDVQAVKAALTAQQPNGDFVNITANAVGRLLFALDASADDGTPAPASTVQVGGRDASGNVQAFPTNPDGAVYVSGAGVQASSLARGFLATTDKISASLGQSIRATLHNPAGSGKNLVLVQIAATSGDTGGLVVGNVYINPDTNTPTTTWTPTCTAIGAASATMQFKADAGSAMSGGTATHLYIALVGSGRKEFELDKLPIIIAPGVTLGLNIPLGALSSTEGVLSAYFIESPA